MITYISLRHQCKKKEHQGHSNKIINFIKKYFSQYSPEFSLSYSGNKFKHKSSIGMTHETIEPIFLQQCLKFMKTEHLDKPFIRISADNEVSYYVLGEDESLILLNTATELEHFFIPPINFNDIKLLDDRYCLLRIIVKKGYSRKKLSSFFKLLLSDIVDKSEQIKILYKDIYMEAFPDENYKDSVFNRVYSNGVIGKINILEDTLSADWRSNYLTVLFRAKNASDNDFSDYKPLVNVFMLLFGDFVKLKVYSPKTPLNNMYILGYEDVIYELISKHLVGIDDWDFKCETIQSDIVDV